MWAYQLSPHDLHDYDGVNESVLLNLPINGAQRKVLVHPDRNGYMYVIDRTNGEVLSAKPFVPVNSVDSINMRTGRPAMNQQKHPDLDVTVRDICPAPPGGKDWQPSAYSPRTGLLYVPHNNLCYDADAVDVSYIEGTPYVGMNEKIFVGAGGNGGVFSAWDPVHAREVWSLPERFPVWSGALVTAGDVVFYGTMDGWFKAVDAHTGKLLWKTKTESGIIGQPTTFLGPDHKQYVAVLIGVGGWAGAIVAGNLDSRDSTAALGLVDGNEGSSAVHDEGRRPLCLRSQVAQLLALCALALASAGCARPEQRAVATLRVCSDPNNLPFSNAKGQGFENEIAQLVASDLHERLAYTWWAQRRGYLRNTITAGLCDVWIGVPSGLGPLLTTQPYYRSTYVFMTRARRQHSRAIV